jgi:hypothetical protein
MPAPEPFYSHNRADYSESPRGLGKTMVLSAFIVVLLIGASYRGGPSADGPGPAPARARVVFKFSALARVKNARRLSQRAWRDWQGQADSDRTSPGPARGRPGPREPGSERRRPTVGNLKCQYLHLVILSTDRDEFPNTGQAERTMSPEGLDHDKRRSPSQIGPLAS